MNDKNICAFKYILYIYLYVYTVCVLVYGFHKRNLSTYMLSSKRVQTCWNSNTIACDGEPIEIYH